METSSRIADFQNAVRNVPGLEWLVEMDVDDIDLHDLYDEETGHKVKGGRFYILSSTKQAIDWLLGLWKRYRAGEEIGDRLGKIKELFTYLLTVRRWDIRDRLRDTGILDIWREDYEAKKGTNSYIDFEIELHYYRTSNAKREQNSQEIRQKIESAGGTVGKIICIDDIAFHALKGKLPVASIGEVVRHNWDTAESFNNFPPVFNSEAVRYFRPTGQHIDGDNGIWEHPLQRELKPVKDKQPVLALLDGAPMLRHSMLDGRINLSDPDDCMSAYAPSTTKAWHCYGMFDVPWRFESTSSRRIVSLARRIYVRPVMKPNQQGNQRGDTYAENFQEDVIERAVREMFEGDESAAPGVRVINLSLGNTEQQVYLQ